MSNHSCPFHVIGVEGLFLLCLLNQLVIRLLWNGINFGIGDSGPCKGWNTLHDFCTDFCLVYSIEESTLVGESESEFAVFGQSELNDFRKPCNV